MEARGRLAEMKKYFGTAKLTNLIADKTRKLEPKRRNECVGINGRLPHTPIGDENPLGFRHNPWKSRLAIVEDILVKYKEGKEPTSPATLYYIPDLERFEQEFIEAHLPWESSGKILCEKCDKDWTASWRVRQNREIITGTTATMVPVAAATNIEQLTVELIFRRLTNAEVLAEVRKVFPGRATMNTVAWYRTHLIHDKSPRFERLRAGRILFAAG
jgi:hypothetical protein